MKRNTMTYQEERRHVWLTFRTALIGTMPAVKARIAADELLREWEERWPHNPSDAIDEDFIGAWEANELK